MTYQELIDKSVVKMGHPRKYGTNRIKGYEQHHIIPICMGGNDDGDNIVYLTTVEHLMAHILLFREHPNNYGVAKAVIMMLDAREDIIDNLVNVVDDEKEFNDYIVNIAEARDFSREEQSKRMSGCGNPNYGKHWSEEWKQQQSERFSGENHPNYGVTRSDEYKQYMSEIMSGENNPNYGTHHSKESNERRSKSVRQYFEEHPEAIELMKHCGKDHYAARAVICLETKEVFDTITEARNKTGVRHISEVCRGERNIAGGYHWMYYDEYLANKIDNQQGSLE